MRVSTSPFPGPGGPKKAAHPSIAIVATHFGPVPLWLPAFLLSCRDNPDVRWLIYTDIEIAGPVPANVEIRATPLQEFNVRCSDTLGTRIEVQRLPKLSDLKPAYGVIFADDLRGFDFWAYSELDIIWGRIRHFMTDRLLADHDLVSAKHFELAGHFTLFRNTERMNRLFEIMPDALATMADPHHFRLDERVFTRELLALLAGDPSTSPRIAWETELTMSAQYQRALPDGLEGNMWWCAGRTYDAECNELMYLHFHKLKSHMRTINFGFEDAPATFMINRRGLYCLSRHGRGERGGELHRAAGA